MTALNAEKYLRGLPECAERTELSSMPELIEAKKRVTVVTCAGLHADMTASMLASVLSSAGICAVLLRFDEPYSAGKERDLLLDGKSLPPDMLSRLVGRIKATARAHGFEERLGRHEALSAAALAACRESGARILIIDASPIGEKLAGVLPTADHLLLGALPKNSSSLLRRLILRDTSEAITVPQLPSVYAALTSCCAENGCRLTASARPGLPGGPRINAESFLGSSFFYRGINAECRAIFGSSVCRAAAVTDCVGALRREGMSIPDAAIVRGIGGAPSGHHGTLVSLAPALISVELPPNAQSGNADAFFSELAADIEASRALLGEVSTVLLASNDESAARSAAEHLEGVNGSKSLARLVLADPSDISATADKLCELAFSETTAGDSAPTVTVIAATADTLRALLPQIGKRLLKPWNDPRRNRPSV